MQACERLLPDTKGHFKFHASRLYLSYHGCHNKNDLTNFLVDILVSGSRADNPVLKKIRCEHDRRDNNAIITRVIINFGTRLWRTIDYHKLDYAHITPIWKTIPSRGSWNALIKFFDKLSSQNNELYGNHLEFNADLSKWTSCLDSIIDNIPCHVDVDDNRINWFYSHRGGVKGDGRGIGKSLFGLWLSYQNTYWIYLSINSANISKISSILIEKIKSSDWNNDDEKPKGIYFDIDTSIASNLRICKVLNNLVHRRIECVDNSKSMILSQHVNIIVMSNSPPTIISSNTQSVSPQDNYNVTEIVDTDRIMHIDMRKLSSYQQFNRTRSTRYDISTTNIHCGEEIIYK